MNDNTAQSAQTSAPSPNLSKRERKLDGWREVKLGDYVDIKHGYAFKGQYITSEVNNNILVTPGNFCIGGGFKSAKFKYFTGVIPQDYVLKEGDVIVTMTDLSKEGDTLGYSAKVPKSKAGEKYLHNQRIGLLRFDSEDVDKNFIYWLMRTSNYHWSIVGSASGTSIRHTSPTTIKQHKFLLPPLPEQKAIAEVLSSLDDKIDLLHRQNKTLEDMAQALFRKWFIEEADESLEEKPLSSFGDVICGKTPPKKVHKYFGGDIPFIKIPDMHGKIFIFDTSDALTKQGKNYQKNKTLPPKSICVSCIATVGLVSMNAFESQTNQQINSIIPRKDEFRYFLYLFMKSSKNLLKAMASGGTATMNLNTSNFSKIMLPTTDETLLLEFSKKVESFFDKIFFNQSQIRTLENLRDTLLPKLMSGVVRVKF